MHLQRRCHETDNNQCLYRNHKMLSKQIARYLEIDNIVDIQVESYFPMQRGCNVILYQDTHCPNDIPWLNMVQGKGSNIKLICISSFLLKLTRHLGAYKMGFKLIILHFDICGWLSIIQYDNKIAKITFQNVSK